MLFRSRDGSRGASAIWRYDLKARKATALTGPGYLQPAWSPDVQFIAATRSDNFGTDIVILDGGTGTELLRVTDDGRSFAPTWSPAGNALAFLRVDGAVVDLWQVVVQRIGATWAPGEELGLTQAAGLDAASRPSWFIPGAQPPVPVTTPAPTPAVTAPRATATARPATPSPKGTR